MFSKAFVDAIVADGYKVPSEQTAMECFEVLMEGLSSAEQGVREDCLDSMTRWIAGGVFAPVEIGWIVDHIEADLSIGVGNVLDDGVFMRSWAVLILAEIVCYDICAGVLTRDDIHHISEIVIRYCEAEQDLRGYEPVKGWAHSVAHTADALTALARHPATGYEGLSEILDAISSKVLAFTDYPFVGLEQRRLGRSLIAVMQRNVVPISDIIAWLERFGRKEHNQPPARWHNVATFLSMIHYQLHEIGKESLLPVVNAMIKRH